MVNTMKNIRKAIICAAGIVLFSLTEITACAGKDGGTADVPMITWKGGNVQPEDAAAPNDAPLTDSQVFYKEVAQVKNTFDTLNVATYITKINDDYFISDCYHDQVIYNDSLTAPLTEWKVLTSDVHYAHTVASDGTVIVIDDTENNRLLVFQKTDSGYVHTQIIENTGLRPHYVQYDGATDTFLAYSSITGEMFYLKKNPPQDNGVISLYVEKILKLDELYAVYVRSFTMLDGYIYFVSGHNNQKIIKAELNADGTALEIKESYPVPDELAGMVQLTKMEDYYYITISTDNAENQDYATIIRCKRLSDLADGNYEDVYQQFGVSGGTPYYITQIDGRYYMAHHRTSQNIIAFDIKDNEIRNVEVIY